MSKDIYDMRKRNASLEKITIAMKPDKEGFATVLHCKVDGIYNVPKWRKIDNPNSSSTFTLVPDKDRMFITICREDEPNIVFSMEAKFEEMSDSVLEWTSNAPD